MKVRVNLRMFKIKRTPIKVGRKYVRERTPFVESEM